MIASIHYWFRATLRPGEVYEAFKADPHKVAASFWINFIFAALYSVTPILLQWGGIRPALPPWMPVEV